MRESFLYGSFLSGYADGHRKRKPAASWNKSLGQIDMTARMTARGGRFLETATRYGLTLPVGLALALGLAILLFRIPIAPKSSFVVVDVQQELVTLEEIQQPKQEILPPAPPRPPVPIEVPNDVVMDDVELDLDVALDLDEAIVDLQPPPAPALPEVEEEPEPEIFVAVEDMPEMIGGIASLMKDVTYPEMARKAGVEGTVVVQIVVDENGMPRDPTIIKSASDLLDEAAVKAVMLQRFKPGKQRGKAVKVKMAIPVIFRLRSPQATN